MQPHGCTDEAQRALKLCAYEAMALNHDYKGTEHLLLGLVREGDGGAGQALTAWGAGRNRAPARLTAATSRKGIAEYSRILSVLLLTSAKVIVLPLRGRCYQYRAISAQE